MSRDPAYAKTEAEYMMLDYEREAADEAHAAGYPKQLPESAIQVLRAARVRRARENISAGCGSIFDYVALGAAETPLGPVHALNQHLLAFKAAQDLGRDEGETP